MTHVVVRRTSDDTYVVEDGNGSEIATYNQTKMTHPDDWIGDVVDAGIDGYHIAMGDWKYIDQR